MQTSDPAVLAIRARRTHLPPEIRLWPHHRVEGNKLTVDFDKAGEKKVIDHFVTRGVNFASRFI